jgi:hypothetical protein
MLYSKVDTRDQDAQRQESITVLLLSLTRFRALEMGVQPPRLGLMISLAHHSSLTYLNIVLMESSVDVLPAINDIVTLEELVIEVDTHATLTYPLDRPLIRPSILTFTLLAMPRTSNLLEYLGRCRVHPSCHVCLELNSHLSKDLAEGIVPFIAAHQFCKLRLALDGQEDDHLRVVGMAMARLPHVVLDGSEGPLLNNYYVSDFTLPTILELKPNWYYSSAEVLWDFLIELDTWATRSNTRSSIIRINANRISPSPLWTPDAEDDDEKATFKEEVQDHAWALYEHGIYVVNQDWEDVQGVLRAPRQPCACGLHI